MAHAERNYASEPAQLARIREFVGAFCRDAPAPVLDEDSINRLELAANETASNIIRHAHHNCADLRIRIEADSWGDGVSLRFHYCGESFDPNGVRPPSFDGSREGGFGVFIISQCVDEVLYSQDDAGSNSICLVKRRAASRKRRRRSVGA